MENSLEKKILVVYTGGTIGMKNSEKGYVPACGYLREILLNSSILNDQTRVDPEKKLLRLPHSQQYRNSVSYEILECAPLLDSSNMGMHDWSKIAQDIFDHYDAFDAFIVLHGTDTMAFTASALSFMLQNLQKTVILTGSQIPLSELRNDGLDNLLGALLIAGNYEIPEVGIYFNNNLLRGNRVTKISTTELEAFGSGNYPPLVKVGIGIDVNWTAIRSFSTKEPFSIQQEMSPHIATLRIFPGITKETVLHFSTPPLAGLVLHTYGSGNAPTHQEFLDALKVVSDSGIVIINCTQCFQGNVEAHYETGKILAEVGVVGGADMTVEAALSKLSFLLAQNLSQEEVKARMTKNLRGELSDPRKTKFSFKDRAFIKSVAEVLGNDVGEVKSALEPILLCSCASIGDLEQFKEMVQSGMEIDCCNYDGRTALHLAASEGHSHVVEYLISQNAKLNPVDRWGGTPLQDAIRHEHGDVIDLLQKAQSARKLL
jgi:60kDa lysophospholipase